MRKKRCAAIITSILFVLLHPSSTPACGFRLQAEGTAIFRLEPEATRRATTITTADSSWSASATTGRRPTTTDRASISADGRFVAFSSIAENLVPNDTNLVL